MNSAYNMRYKGYKKIGTIVRQSTGVPSKPLLTSKQVDALRNVSYVVLATLAFTGVATVALVAPNLVGAIGKLFLSNGKKQKLTLANKQAKTIRALYYLKASGLIKMNTKANDPEISLTEEGVKKLEEIGFKSMYVERREAWDGHWWQVAADIPTLTHRSEADSFRFKLKRMEFYPLQRTLWFYPFDPRKELEKLVQHFHIGQYVTVMEICSMDVEDEKVLKTFFRERGVL